MDEQGMFTSSEPLRVQPFGVRFGGRFGHSMCSIDSKILCLFGGFGELATDPNGKHLRLSAIEVCHLDQMSLHVIDAKASQIGMYKNNKNF